MVCLAELDFLARAHVDAAGTEPRSPALLASHRCANCLAARLDFGILGKQFSSRRRALSDGRRQCSVLDRVDRSGDLSAAWPSPGRSAGWRILAMISSALVRGSRVFPYGIRHVAALGVTALALSAVNGCGSNSDLPQTATASGKVMYQGKPLNIGTVTFHPEGTGNPGVGLLQQDGTFTISTYTPGDGAVLGKHSVT